MISCASRMTSTVCSKASTSNVPSGRRNFMRFSEARLHALSSTCMYSEHGFDALMRPEFGEVCHPLIVVSNWTPGSAQRHAASAMSRMSRSEEHTSELQSRQYLVCRLLLEKKKNPCRPVASCRACLREGERGSP